uniref:Glycosyl hydrolase family 13 catalytic domain-containing protein n=1 Tax=Meloidogyne javanica TaxID=6303 RepID=A0A915MDJ3_MELJA
MNIWTLSFSDSNSDNIGDLIGIIQKLDYLRRLGVGAIFLRPIMRVEKSGLGVIEYNKLASKIGNFEQFNELIIKARKKGIRVLIDFPLVLTSISNPWFDKSALASAHPEDAHFADFFIWRRGIPNSEFISEYCGSTLKYFHVKERPDLPVLHWTNKNVSDIIKAALSFWINKGVDGFHFSSIEYLYRSEDGKDPNWEKIAKILRSLRIFIDDEKGGGGNAREKM